MPCRADRASVVLPPAPPPVPPQVQPDPGLPCLESPVGCDQFRRCQPKSLLSGHFATSVSLTHSAFGPTNRPLESQRTDCLSTHPSPSKSAENAPKTASGIGAVGKVATFPGQNPGTNVRKMAGRGVHVSKATSSSLRLCPSTLSSDVSHPLVFVAAYRCISIDAHNAVSSTLHLIAAEIQCELCVMNACPLQRLITSPPSPGHTEGPCFGPQARRLGRAIAAALGVSERERPHWCSRCTTKGQLSHTHILSLN